MSISFIISTTVESLRTGNDRFKIKIVALTVRYTNGCVTSFRLYNDSVGVPAGQGEYKPAQHNERAFVPGNGDALPGLPMTMITNLRRKFARTTSAV